MSKARDLANFSDVAPDIGRKNLIINGAMQVAQRGTSATGVTTSGVYVVDRFTNNVVDTAEFTISQSTTAPTGFASSLKWENTTANASPLSGYYATLNQRIEGQNLQHLKYGTSDAQSVTLSFWVRSNKTGTYVAELLQPDASSRHINKSYTINSADTWEQKTITFEGDTSGVINNDNGVGLIVSWFFNAGSGYTSGTLQTSWGALDQTARAVGQVNLADTVGNTFYITGVQLEVGSVATPFEHRSYGEELAACMRYYLRMNPTGNYTRYADGYWASADLATVNVYFPVPMRTNPALDDTGVASDYIIITGSSVNNLTSLPSFSKATQTSDGSCIFANLTAASTGNGVAGQATQLTSLAGGNWVGDFLGFDAEL